MTPLVRTALLRVAVTAACVLVLDQITKALILARVDALSGAMPTVGFTITMNRAIAFSIPIEGVWVFALGLAILIGVGALLIQELDWAKLWSAILSGMILGGALGNFVDRVRFGAVVDFLKVGWWPVFNLADAAISTATVALIVFGGSLAKHRTSLRSPQAD